MIPIKLIRLGVKLLKVTVIVVSWVAWFFIIKYIADTLEMKVGWSHRVTEFLTLAASLLGMAWSIRLTIRNPGGNKGLVLHDPFFSIYPNIEIINGKPEIVFINQEGCAEKMFLTFYWQRNLGEPIDMVKDVSVSNDEDEQYQTTDGDYISFKYVWPISPDPEFLVNRIKYDDGEIKERYKALQEEFFNREVCSRSSESFSKGNFMWLTELFNETGPPSMLHVLEIETGTKMGEIKIKDMDRASQTQKAHAALANAMLVEKMIEASKDSDGNPTLTRKEAWRQINMSDGEIDAKYWEFDGLPQGLHHLHMEGMGGAGGKKTK